MRPTSLLVAAVTVLAINTAHARDYKAGAIDVADPWSRATPKGASVGAGYMKISNSGTAPDRLMGGSSDAASKFEVHEMTMENGVAKMRPLTTVLRSSLVRQLNSSPARSTSCSLG